MTPGDRFQEISDEILRLSQQYAGSMRYFKRRWDENRGDEYSNWGCSHWYFEVTPDGAVIRQMEIYDNGSVLRYHPDHWEDHFGGLAEKELDLEEFGPFSMTKQEFENAWTSHPPTNDGGNKKGA